MQRACHFLARREHSRQELKYKLAHTGASDSLLDELLNKLTDNGLQSDERFAESFIHHRINKGQGPIKIEQALLKYGIEKDIIRAYLYLDQINWSVLIEKVRAKKFGQALPDTYQDKAKQSRFLYSRGFSLDVINALLR